MIKYSGAGNTFAILLASEVPASKRQALAPQISDPTFGLAVDGVLFLEPDVTKQSDYIWDFFNSDGSRPEMCGNAARCAAKYVFEEIKTAKAEITFSTPAGLIHCRREGSLFSVQMPRFKIKEQNKLVLGHRGLWVDTGVPHFVLKQNLEKFECAKLRSHPDFGSMGTNVTLVQNLGPGQMKSVTFERGVEGFTQACGTGAVAAAVFGWTQDKVQKHEIEMPGGRLYVEFSSENEVRMTGPASKLAEINWFHGKDQK